MTPTRSMLPPFGEFDLSDLPDSIPDYSGDLDGLDVDECPRSVHMAFALAITNADRADMAQDRKRDTVDALAQAWRAVTPDDQTVTVEHSRSATSVAVGQKCLKCGATDELHSDQVTGRTYCRDCLETMRDRAGEALGGGA